MSAHYPALDTLVRGELRPSRMDEERRAYLENQRLIQRSEGHKATQLDHARGFSVAQHNRRK